MTISLSLADFCVRSYRGARRDVPESGLLPHVQHSQARLVQNICGHHDPGELGGQFRTRLIAVRVKARRKMSIMFLCFRRAPVSSIRGTIRFSSIVDPASTEEDAPRYTLDKFLHLKLY